MVPMTAYELDFSGPFAPEPGFRSPFVKFQAHFPLRGRSPPAEDRRHPCQVVGGQGEHRLRLRLHLCQAYKPRLPQRTHVLAQGKDLLDPLADLQAGAQQALGGIVSRPVMA